MRPVLLGGLMLAAVACYDSDEFYKEQNDPVVEEEAFFDFSTTQTVDMIIDYSDYDIHGPVLFRIYSENPIVNENEVKEYLDERIEPVFEAYTDKRGIFDATITLPAYAQVLHIVTGNFMIGLKRSVIAVEDGVANVKVTRGSEPASVATRANGEGVSTNDISNLRALSYNTNKSGVPTTRVYKDWVTPLGTWNSATGRPDYLMDQATAPLALRFSDEVIDGLYATVSAALSGGSKVKDEYRAEADLTLIKDSEVSICAVGGMTCWNSCVGYYYYDSNHVPQTPMDLNIIMLFPNTQDGYRYEPVGGPQYQNNIGMQRGDVIQLMYYPNIADGDLTTVSTVFPRGTRLGFILKTNGWAYQGREYCTKKGGSYWDAKMNIWSASTEGMSYCNQEFETFRYPNLSGDARTALFAYTSPTGHQYAMLTFEDACDDLDFDDVAFALNPADVFAELPKVSNGTTATRGVYAFEDRWPHQADYDMNDVMVDCKQELTFVSGSVSRQFFAMKTYQNFVSDKSGLAVRLDTRAIPDEIIMKVKVPGSSILEDASFTFDGEAYYLTDDVKRDIGTTYYLDLRYNTPQNLSNIAKVQPFIWRDNTDGSRWEVHIPYEAPTSNMDRKFFNTADDKSVIRTGKWYVSDSDYPFSFYLDNAKIEDFVNTILLFENESKPIDVFFPEFIEWSTSRGARNADWYLHPIQ